MNGEQPEGFAIKLTKFQKDHYGQQFGENEKPEAPGIIGNFWLIKKFHFVSSL